MSVQLGISHSCQIVVDRFHQVYWRWQIQTRLPDTLLFEKKRHQAPAFAYGHWYSRIFFHFLADDHERVLDPFYGSGITLEEADIMNRQWVGIEKKITI